MDRTGKIVTSAVAAVALVAAGGWWWFAAQGPGPEGAARSLVRALSSNDLSTVAFAATPNGRAQRQWDEIVAGMEDTPHRVRLEEVTEHDDGTADARLRHTWRLGEGTWTYRTTARLRRTDDSWRVRFSPALVEPSLRPGEVLDRTALEPDRGDIVGDGGAVLVTERPVLRFGIDKTRVDPEQQERSARRLAALLDVDADSLVGKVEASGDRAFVEALVLREEDVTTRISAGYEDIPGATALSDEMPLAPTREFARPILGTVGPVTAELIEESNGAYEVGDEVGLSGLQRRYEDHLAGHAGYQVSAENAEGGRRELFTVEPTAGRPLRTTLDPDLQARAEQVLAGTGPASALVAIRPSDGHLLAAASGPGSQGYSTATLGRYAPGSTFKVVTSLALLRSGLGADTAVECPATVSVNGKSFENYDDYPAAALGRIDLRTAVAHSCNTALIEQRDRAPQDALATAAASLGLGLQADLGFEAFLGSVPDRAGATEHAASMIGQGKVLASPLAMATAAASVAGGRTVVPTLLPERRVDAQGPARPLTGAEARSVRQLMRAVVTEGSATFLSDVPGEPVVAKTGTAEYGTEAPPRTHAWMIAAQGDLAVAVFVETGDSGSATAGPLLEQFLRAAR